MRLLILGGGSNQINGIITAQKKGYEVVLTDYYENAPGRAYATFNETVSTFDVEGNIEVAKKYCVDGVMTLGTDQPVYTVAKVAEALDLPMFLDTNTAVAVTNKKIMKRILVDNNIPTATYKIVTKDNVALLDNEMKYPLVLKPIDSQGQRGVFRVYNQEEIQENIIETLQYSRENELLLEEYYESDEITVSAWVEAGTCYLLTITDRETFSTGKHIGICYEHHFPSKYLNSHYEPIKKIMNDIVKAFTIQNGPIYVQLLIGRNQIIVNEVACRIGGAYEDVFIPYLTNFNILDMVIDHSLGIGRICRLNEYDLLNNMGCLSVQLFFCDIGKVEYYTSVNDLQNLQGVLTAGYNISIGKDMTAIKDATARAGYIIITGADERELAKNIDRVYEYIIVLSDQNKNLVINMKNYLGR